MPSKLSMQFKDKDIAFNAHSFHYFYKDFLFKSVVVPGSNKTTLQGLRTMHFICGTINEWNGVMKGGFANTFRTDIKL